MTMNADMVCVHFSNMVSNVNIMRKSGKNQEKKERHDVWCTSPSHCYFCTKDIDGPNLTPFLIPFTKVMHLIERRKLLDRFSKYSKLREL